MNRAPTEHKTEKKKGGRNLMLKRKIEQSMQEWKNTVDRKPLIIKGCRQCGKTSPVLVVGIVGQ